MDEGFTRKEKLVGLFLLLIVILTKVTLLVIAQGKGWFQSYRHYVINVKQGYNLHQGSLVKMFNTEIGKVTNMRIVRLQDQPSVEVHIKILTEYADFIRQDSRAEVVSPTFIGSEYIEISPGSQGYPPIQEHDPIPYFQSRKPLTEMVGQLLNDDNLQQVQTILTNVRQLSDQLQQHEKEWNETVKRLDEVMVAILKSQGTLGDLLMRRDFLNRMAKTLENIDQTFKEAKVRVGDFKPTAKGLEALVADLRREVETLRSILADLKAGSQGVPALVEEASDTTKSGKEVVDAVKQNPLIRLTLPREKQSGPLHVEPRHVQ